MKYIITLILFLPLYSQADVILCVGETGAGIENTGVGGFKSEIYDVSNQKFVLSNDSGAWLLKQMGIDAPVFDHCVSEYMCMMKNGYSGVFMRQNDGVFTYSINQAYGPDLKKQIMLTVKGLCSKL
jgi:hypothetical protein